MTLALITRPDNEAAKLAVELDHLGIKSLVEPVISIEYMLSEILPDVPIQLVAITSMNAVRALAGITERRDLSLLVVGEKTANVARHLGFTNISVAGGDATNLASEVLNHFVPNQGVVYYPSGDVIAIDLQQILAAQGIAVMRQVLYKSIGSPFLSVATISAITQYQVDLALFFSRRSAHVFLELATQHGLIGHLAEIKAVVLSNKVAEILRQFKWRDIGVATQPTQEAMLNICQALRQE